MQPTSIISPIIEAITEFVTGFGESFLHAFQTVFMNATVVDGVTTFSGINNLGIFVLSLFGLSLAYGVIRFVTGLFRRETR